MCFDMMLGAVSGLRPFDWCWKSAIFEYLECFVFTRKRYSQWADLCAQLFALDPMWFRNSMFEACIKPFMISAWQQEWAWRVQIVLKQIAVARYCRMLYKFLFFTIYTFFALRSGLFYCICFAFWQTNAQCLPKPLSNSLRSWSSHSVQCQSFRRRSRGARLLLQGGCGAHAFGLKSQARGASCFLLPQRLVVPCFFPSGFLCKLHSCIRIAFFLASSPQMTCWCCKFRNLWIFMGPARVSCCHPLFLDPGMLLGQQSDQPTSLRPASALGPARDLPRLPQDLPQRFGLSCSRQALVDVHQNLFDFSQPSFGWTSVPWMWQAEPAERHVLWQRGLRVLCSIS